MSTIRANMQERAGYRFYQILRILSTQINPIILDKNFIPPRSQFFARNLLADQLHNEMSWIKFGFGQLVNAVSTLNMKMEAEESARKHFRVDKSLDDKIQEGERIVIQLKKEVNQLDLEFEEKKREIISQQQILSEQIEMKNDQASLKIMEDIAADGTYTSDIVRLQADRRDAQFKLDAACCGCFPCSSTKEKKALKDIDEQIDALQEKEIQRKKKADERRPSDTVRVLQAEENQLKLQLQQLIQDYPAKILELKSLFDHEEEALQAAKIKMHNSRDKYFSQISTDNVVNYVRAYASLIELIRLITQAYSTKYKLMQAKIDATDPLNLLNNTLAGAKQQAESEINQLWYNTAQSKSLTEAYNCFLAWPIAEKIEFLQGKLTNEFLQKISDPSPNISLGV